MLLHLYFSTSKVLLPGRVILLYLCSGKLVSGRSDPPLETKRELYGANMASAVIACVCEKKSFA